MLARAVSPLALLALSLAVPQLALAQSTETCVASPQPPTMQAESDGDPLHAHLPANARPHTGGHGQGLYGSETLYLSHLPVFMGQPERHPHNFQVILEVEFVNPEAKALYRADRDEHQDVIYTALPRSFDQMELFSEEPEHKPLRKLPVTDVYRGHFEDGGQKFLPGVELEILNVVHFREFLSGASKLSGQHYLLFGRGDDMYLAHLLSAPPDFDQILRVELEIEDGVTEATGAMLADLLANGLYMHLADRDNTVEARLRQGDLLNCSVETGTRALPFTVELHVAEEAYCEEGEFDELVTTDFNAPRPCGN